MAAAGAKPIVVVFTANSNTGEAAINHLLGSGKVAIRAVVRNLSNKDDDFDAHPDVEYMLGDVAKFKSLGPVFEGCSAAYFATPATKDRAKLGKMFVDACFEYSVSHAVIISVVGAETKQTAYHKQFGEIEDYAMSKAGQPVKVAIADRGHKKFQPVIVRSALFYQNFYGMLGGLLQGKLFYPLGDDGSNTVTQVDLDDVGLVVATILEDPAPHAGRAYNIVGDTKTGNQLSTSITTGTSVHVEFESVPDEVAVAAFKAMQLQGWIAEGNVESVKFCREGGMAKYGAGDFQALTGKLPKTFKTFAKESLKPLLHE